LTVASYDFAWYQDQEVEEQLDKEMKIEDVRCLSTSCPSFIYFNTTSNTVKMS